MTDDYSNLVQKINALNVPERTYLEIAKVHNKEVPIQNLLAYFFRPNENHGLGDVFIKALLNTKYYELGTNGKSKGILKSSVSNQEPFSTITGVNVKTEVRTEKTDDTKKRIDILIHNKDFVICIEFKVNHELNNPLRIYKEYVEKRFNNKVVFFIVLTPYKKKVGLEATVGKDDFIQIMLGDFIKEVKALLPLSIFQNPCHQTLYLLDFIRTIENRSERERLEKEFLGIIGEIVPSIETLPYIPVSSYWQKFVVKKKLEHLKAELKGEFHNNSRGGFVEIKFNQERFKIRIVDDKYQVEKWSLKGDESNNEIIDSLNLDESYRSIIEKIKSWQITNP